MAEFSKILRQGFYLFVRAVKSFGYICIGVSVCALIEIGVYWEIVGMLVLAVGIVILSYPVLNVLRKQLDIAATWESHLKQKSTDLERLKYTFDNIGVKYNEREYSFDKSLIELDIKEPLDEVYNSLTLYFTKDGSFKEFVPSSGER